MPQDPIEIDIVVKDDASATIDAVAAKAGQLEKETVEIPVDTTGAPHAEQQLDTLETIRNRLDQNPAVIDIKTDFASARQDLESAEQHIGNLQGKLAGVGQTLSSIGFGQIARDISPIAGDLSDAAGAAGQIGAPLAAAAPLMVVAAAGAAAIRDNMKEAAEVKALNTQNVQEFADALREGGDAAGVLLERVQKTGELKIATLLDGTKDIVPALAKAGVTVEQFTKAAEGGKEGIGKLAEALKAAKVPGEDAAAVLQGAVAAAENIKDANQRAADVTKVLGDTTKKAGDEADKAAGKQDKQAAATDAAAKAAQGASLSIGQYVALMATIPAEKKTEIQAAIDRGDLAEAERLLNAAARSRTAVINVALRGANIGAQLGTIIENSVPGGTMVSLTTVNLPAGARGVDALREVTGAARRAGTRYGSAAVSRARR